jgi:hypothetical protein
MLLSNSIHIIQIVILIQNYHQSFLQMYLMRESMNDDAMDTMLSLIHDQLVWQLLDVMQRVLMVQQHEVEHEMLQMQLHVEAVAVAWLVAAVDVASVAVVRIAVVEVDAFAVVHIVVASLVVVDVEASLLVVVEAVHIEAPFAFAVDVVACHTEVAARNSWLRQ